MSNFLETVPETEAQGAVGDLFEGLRAALGHLPNYGLTFGHRPELWDAWRPLARTVASNMDLRRYELATLAAAVTLKSSYCALAHSEKLLDLGSTEYEVRSIALGPLAAGLPEVEQAIVDYAAKIARDTSTVTEEDMTNSAVTGSPTVRSSTLPRPLQSDVSSASCWMPWAPSPIMSIWTGFLSWQATCRSAGRSRALADPVSIGMPGFARA